MYFLNNRQKKRKNQTPFLIQDFSTRNASLLSSVIYEGLSNRTSDVNKCKTSHAYCYMSACTLGWACELFYIVFANTFFPLCLNDWFVSVCCVKSNSENHWYEKRKKREQLSWLVKVIFCTIICIIIFIALQVCCIFKIL